MRLGQNQAAVLRALRQHGIWYGGGFGCGWNWTNESGTRKILDSLVRRGLVSRADAHIGGRDRIVYRAIDEGVKP